MAVEIITKQDLFAFHRQLLEDLSKLIGKRQAEAPKKVLKSAEVRRLLHISPSTLQKLRVEGTLPSVKVGGTHYYRAEDIARLLNGKEVRS
ncbi:helix-turn-helix domain-containing protein [Pontibacter sp. HSC-14F20]|uniref:helix-turn-helix domain-containing protein n=1 Tax=Pontibacter sp. HSC-14F20 TaxID=2864136 RepID=UPI001C72DA53|nr:helix-turn-helix domain-containing protein [Pontibacter sp. HSC-14F20]MBX0334092.1 helix-turn-helix domain-containing protein [Pontibacter sp. HSC-14F20]